MGSGSLSLRPLGQGRGGPCANLVGAGRPSFSREAYLSRQGPRRDLSQEAGHSGAVLGTISRTRLGYTAHSVVSSEALVSGTPVGSRQLILSSTSQDLKSQRA